MWDILLSQMKYMYIITITYIYYSMSLRQMKYISAITFLTYLTFFINFECNFSLLFIIDNDSPVNEIPIIYYRKLIFAATTSIKDLCPLHNGVSFS